MRVPDWLDGKFEALDKAPFECLPAASRTRDVFIVDHLVEASVDAWCRKLHAEFRAEAATIRSDRRYAWEWICARLAVAPTPDEGLIEFDGDPGVMAAFELIDTAARGYPAFLRGELDGPQILLGRESGAAWKRYFANENFWYCAVNLAAAAAASVATPGDNLRVLEVGGGFGSAAEALITTLGDRLGHYLFTERAPYFFAMGKVALQRRFPAAPLEFARVDVQEPLEGQGVPRDSFDLVHAVNVLHAVPDLVPALRGLRDALRPGGTLLLGEAIRPQRDFPIATEFVFQLMPEFREFVVEPFRPRGGFMFFGDWPAALVAAGFEDVRVTPDFERVVPVYPTYTLASISARRPL